MSQKKVCLEKEKKKFVTGWETIAGPLYLEKKMFSSCSKKKFAVLEIEPPPLTQELNGRPLTSKRNLRWDCREIFVSNVDTVN